MAATLFVVSQLEGFYYLLGLLLLVSSCCGGRLASSMRGGGHIRLNVRKGCCHPLLSGDLPKLLTAVETP